MINEKYARRYCADDISKVENYEQAVSDDSQAWDIHHRAEILPCGWFSRKDLKKFGLYWHRPASELIFLTHTEHTKLHHVGWRHSEDTRRKMSEARTGKHFSHFSKEHRQKLSEAEKKTPVEQYSTDGTFIARYPSTKEAERRTGARQSSICNCCRGRCGSAGGYVWKYA